ncbi:hypothetical protein JCM30566_09070 [Marinitoga arctica]
MVINYYYNQKLIFRYKEKGFKNKKINIVDHYGIIKDFEEKKEMNKYIIKNSRNYDISTKKVKYIALKDKVYYLYIENYIKKFKNTLFFDYTIPLNLLLWKYIDNVSFEDDYITFVSKDNNIIYQKSSNGYIYGVYLNEIMGNEINLNESLLIKIIKELKGDLKNAVYV